ncbi:MAG: hypothetical protein Q8N51_05820 [Gammaproteobacteria bacterium]|nr:hypothetical protein [Gammaproteobacteria bacterium]
MPAPRDDAAMVIAWRQGGGNIGRATLTPSNDTNARAMMEPLHV